MIQLKLPDVSPLIRMFSCMAFWGEVFFIGVYCGRTSVSKVGHRQNLLTYTRVLTLILMSIVINNGMIKYAEKLLEISKIVAQRKK